MQSQDAATAILFKLWPRIEANKNKIIGGAVIVVIAAFSFWAYTSHHEQNEITAGTALTQAVISIPPDANPDQVADAYLKIADDYPGTPAAQRALLQSAAALFEEGKYADAQTHFQKFLDANPDNEFSGQAALGVAKCLDAQGKTKEAAGVYQHVINDFADAQAISAAKFSLARIDEQQGNLSDAVRLYTEIAQANPYNSLGSDAARRALELRSKSSSASPSTTTPASSFNLSH